LDLRLRLTVECKRMGSQMAAIARFLARRIPASEVESEVLKQLALFAFAGLLISFLLVSYVLDLSAGFF
jgi:predicted exporter